MGKTTRFLTSLLIAAVVSWPAAAAAQATRRSGGESSGGSSDGGGATTRSAPEPSPSSGSAEPRVAIPRDSPSPSTSSGSGQTSDGAARPSGTADRVRASGGATTSSEQGRVATGATRTRGSRGAEGYAVARDFRGGGGSGGAIVFYPSYWAYTSNFGYYGYGYDPWYGVGSRFSIYNSWYNPYNSPYYGPFGLNPYSYGPSYWEYPVSVSTGGGWGGWRDDDDVDDRSMGSIRLRANPGNAKVYIDGALAGTVDDFDGFSNHLKLEAGKHVIELRADGYQSYSTEVAVAAGRTLTARATLKRTR